MKLLDMFSDFLGAKKQTKKQMTYMGDIKRNVIYKSYALTLAIEKIAEAVGMCHFCTYEKDKEVKKDNYYRFNVAPNHNQTPMEFFKDIVSKAILDEEGALVVMQDGMYIVAEDFEMVERNLHGNLYKNVRIGEKNTITLKPKYGEVFREKEVLHFKLKDEKVRSCIDGLLGEYTQLISGAVRSYNRKNATKLIVKIGTLFNQLQQKKVTINEEGEEVTEYDLTLDDLFKNRLKQYISDKDSATPIEEGLEIEDKSFSSNGKIEDTRDITKLLEDMTNIAADTFGIPRGLLKGDVADVEEMTNNFITFCINPIAKILQDEINKKIYTKEEYLNGTRLVVKTETIKNYDLTKVAASAEALFRVGAINVNYIRRILREPEIKEEWANDYALTKNYTYEREKA